MTFFQGLNSFFLWYFVFINGVYILVLILGFIKVYLRRTQLAVENNIHILTSECLPEISFVIPVYNGEKDIISAIENLLNLSYRYKQIVIVNDGSTDGTLDIIKTTFNCISIPKLYTEPIPTQKVRGVFRSRSHPDILLIDKEHGKRFDTVNAGINAASNPLFITVDADTYIDSPCFETLIRPILTSPQTIATGAGLRIRNGCTLEFNRISSIDFPKSYLCAMQSLEYLRAFLMRQGWDYLGGNFLISGAFAAFAKEAVVRAGGYGPTPAEDMEIVTRLHRFMKEQRIPYNMHYLPDPIGWTDGPATFKGLGKQRTTWQKGTMESLWFHKQAIFNPKYGALGLFVMPFSVLTEVLGPFIETAAYVWIICGFFWGFIDQGFVCLCLSLSWGFTMLFSPLCLLIGELSFKEYPSLRSLTLLLLSGIIENIGYRQLTIFWRFRGYIAFLQHFKTIQKNGHKIKELFINSMKDKPKNSSESEV